MRSESEIKTLLSEHIKRRDKLKSLSDEYERMNDSPSGMSSNPYKKDIVTENHVIQTLKWVLS